MITTIQERYATAPREGVLIITAFLSFVAAVVTLINLYQVTHDWIVEHSVVTATGLPGQWVHSAVADSSLFAAQWGYWVVFAVAFYAGTVAVIKLTNLDSLISVMVTTAVALVGMNILVFALGCVPVSVASGVNDAVASAIAQKAGFEEYSFTDSKDGFYLVGDGQGFTFDRFESTDESGLKRFYTLRN